MIDSIKGASVIAGSASMQAYIAALIGPSEYPIAVNLSAAVPAASTPKIEVAIVIDPRATPTSDRLKP